LKLTVSVTCDVRMTLPPVATYSDATVSLESALGMRKLLLPRGGHVRTQQWKEVRHETQEWRNVRYSNFTSSHYSRRSRSTDTNALHVLIHICVLVAVAQSTKGSEFESR
jgi:hypothetical protein